MSLITANSWGDTRITIDFSAVTTIVHPSSSWSLVSAAPVPDPCLRGGRAVATAGAVAPLDEAVRGVAHVVGNIRAQVQGEGRDRRVAVIDSGARRLFAHRLDARVAYSRDHM